MSELTALPEAIKPCMQGVVPSIIVTCSKEGVPNTTILSQVFWIDPHQIALSFQFFNKTIRNVRENPHASVRLFDPTTLEGWVIECTFDHSETEGPVFDAMDMQIEAIASMTGLSGVFKLKASDFYRVLSVRKIESL